MEIGDVVPAERTAANSIRASLVRFLALGGDERTPVHEAGVTIRGAWLTGTLDLAAATAVRPLGLWVCRIEHIDASHATLQIVSLVGSRVIDGINLAGSRCSGAISLREGFYCSGEVFAIGAQIDGNFECTGGRFENEKERGVAIDLSGARITGLLHFRGVEGSHGHILLSRATVDSLADDFSSWASRPGRLVLDGFTYGGFTGTGVPVDAATRLKWLALQWPEHIGDEFKPQPWEQLIAVLRATGHPEAARSIAIAKQDRLRQAKVLPKSVRPFHRLYGLLVGYGYRPMRLLAATATVWLLCASAYWMASNPAWFGTKNHLLAPPPSEPGRAAPAPDYRNFVPLIYSADVLLPVVDLGYKDEWQPVVADRAGNPLIWGQLLRFLYWFEIAFGWVAGLLLVGVLGNLIKKD
jgi:hypothetical protein